jgi:hypothetical protein
VDFLRFFKGVFMKFSLRASVFAACVGIVGSFVACNEQKGGSETLASSSLAASSAARKKVLYINRIDAVSQGNTGRVYINADKLNAGLLDETGRPVQWTAEATGNEISVLLVNGADAACMQAALSAKILEATNSGLRGIRVSYDNARIEEIGGKLSVTILDVSICGVVAPFDPS